MLRLSDIIDRIRNFARDDTGAAGIEFLASCPLLFGVLVFTAEYGQALRVRGVLDGAVADAARFLARAPAAAVDQSGTEVPDIYASFENQAKQIIETRTGRSVYDGGSDAPAFEVTVTLVDQGNFRTNYYVVDVTSTVVVSMPLLSMFGLHKPSNYDKIEGTGTDYAVAMTSSSRTRYLGAVPIGVVACPQVSRMNQNCPGS